MSIPFLSGLLLYVQPSTWPGWSYNSKIKHIFIRHVFYWYAWILISAFTSSLCKIIKHHLCIPNIFQFMRKKNIFTFYKKVLCLYKLNMKKKTIFLTVYTALKGMHAVNLSSHSFNHLLKIDAGHASCHDLQLLIRIAGNPIIKIYCTWNAWVPNFILT